MKAKSLNLSLNTVKNIKILTYRLNYETFQTVSFIFNFNLSFYWKFTEEFKSIPKTIIFLIFTCVYWKVIKNVKFLHSLTLCLDAIFKEILKNIDKSDKIFNEIFNNDIIDS